MLKESALILAVLGGALGLGRAHAAAAASPPIDAAEVTAPRRLAQAEMEGTRGGVTVTSITPSTPADSAFDNPNISVLFKNDLWQTSSVHIRIDASGYGKTAAATISGLSPPNYAGAFNYRTYWPPGSPRNIQVFSQNPSGGDWYLSATGTTLRTATEVRVYKVSFFNGSWGSFTGTLSSAVIDPVMDNLTEWFYDTTDSAVDAVFAQCTLTEKRQQWRRTLPGTAIPTATLSAGCIDFAGPGIPAACRDIIGRATGDNSYSDLRVLSVQSIVGFGAFQVPLTYTSSTGQTRSVEIIITKSNVMSTAASATSWFSHEVGHAVFRLPDGGDEHTCANGQTCNDPDFPNCICPTTAAECPAGAGTNVMCPWVGGRKIDNTQCSRASYLTPIFSDVN